MGLKKKGTIVLTILIILVIAIILWNITKSKTFQFFGEIYPRVETEEKVVALTFDDGPTEKTEEVLAILRDLDVKATFFLVGEDLERNMNQARRIVAEDHQIGNHSYSHQRNVLKTYSFVKSEIEKTDDLIVEAGYEGEILFRPPYGKKLFILPFYLNQHDRKSIMWDVEPETYPEVAGSSESITQYVLENTKPGSIILLHVMFDSRQETVEALEGIVTGLRQKGYTFKRVSELIE